MTIIWPRYDYRITQRDEGGNEKYEALWDVINHQSFFTFHIFTKSFVKIVMNVFYLQNHHMYTAVQFLSLLHVSALRFHQLGV